MLVNSNIDLNIMNSVVFTAFLVLFTFNICRYVSHHTLSYSSKSDSFQYSVLLIQLTYEHNWPLHPFGQDHNPDNYSAYVVRVTFKQVWWRLQFNVDSKG